MVEVPEQLVREVQALLVSFAAPIGTEDQRLDRAEQLHDELAKCLEKPHCWLQAPFGLDMKRCITCHEWSHTAPLKCPGDP